MTVRHSVLGIFFNSFDNFNWSYAVKSFAVTGLLHDLNVPAACQMINISLLSHPTCIIITRDNDNRSDWTRDIDEIR